MTKATIEQQLSFQKHKTTGGTLVRIKGKVVDSTENEKYTVGLFLGFRKAFNLIKHKILINKSPLYGTRTNDRLLILKVPVSINLRSTNLYYCSGIYRSFIADIGPMVCRSNRVEPLGSKSRK